MSATQYFQRYSQRENAVTNNVLMLLQRIYDLRQRKFQAVLSSLVQKSETPGLELDVGPRFRQQIRGPERVADGLISQLGFDLLIETKLGPEFDVAQAIGHLKQLRNSANPVLMLLGTNTGADHSSLLRTLRDAQPEGTGVQVRIVACSFKDLIDECRGVVAEHDEQLRELVDDFESFCLESELLPIDDHTLFVPPCGQSFDENIRWKLYYCPTSRARRSGNWLGIYRDKSVQAIGRIDLIVDVYADDQGNVRTGAARDE